MTDRNKKNKYCDAASRIQIDPAVLEETKKKMLEARESTISYELVEHPKKKWYQNRRIMSRVALLAACFCVLIVAVPIVGMYFGFGAKEETAMDMTCQNSSSAPMEAETNAASGMFEDAKEETTAAAASTIANDSTDAEKSEETTLGGMEVLTGADTKLLYESFFFARTWTKEQMAVYVNAEADALLGLNAWKQLDPAEVPAELPVYLEYGNDEEDNCIGDYPVRTLEEAREALAIGDCRSGYDGTQVEDADILEIELVYDDSMQGGVSLPVYRFVALVKEPETGKELCAVFDVPAVADEYVEWE